MHNSFIVRTLYRFTHRKLIQDLAKRPYDQGIVNSGMLLFASMTIVNAGNYLFNLILGRWLGPAAFADMSLLITLFLLVTLITSTIQMVSARFAAMHTAATTAERTERMRLWIGRRAWLLGSVLMAALALGAPYWQQFFHIASPWPFALLGLGLPFYFAQGVDRGVLQGRTQFGALALTFQVEMWVRLIAAIVLVAYGWATLGAVMGLTLSLVMTWVVGYKLAGHPTTSVQPLTTDERRAIISFAGPVITALIGQALINNSDILIVKHFFAAESSGHYAALALIGRIVFFGTISVVAMMFPLVAQKQQRGEPHRHLLFTALGLVAAASTGVTIATLLAPDHIVRLVFGAAYLPIAPLLWLYAIATACYALANVIINYHLATGAGSASTLAIGAGSAQVVTLWLFHHSLREVVLVQVYLMGILFVALLIWDHWLVKRSMPGNPLKRYAHFAVSDRQQ